MKKLILTILSFALIQGTALSQQIQWQKCLGGTGLDDAYSIQQTLDGGYIVAGLTYSNDGHVSGNHGSSDFWVVKLDGSGNISWQKCLGGTGGDAAFSIQQTSDGGYIVAGSTESNDGNVLGNHGGEDYWVVKLDSSGNIIWQKCLGGTGGDFALSIQQTSDGGYIVAGLARSNDGDVSGNHGAWDYWVVKLNSSGNITWQKCLGGTDDDIAESIQQTSDGGYIVAGYTDSNNGDVSGNHGGEDYWVVKLDSSGNITWQKCLGGSSRDNAYSIQQTSDGGYIVAGLTRSNDGDVSGNHSFRSDYWVVKLDSSGNITWQKCYGGTQSDWAEYIQQTSDGGYIITGESSSVDGDVSGNHGAEDFWVVKLNSSGDTLWTKCLGGTSEDLATVVKQISDGGYIMAGTTYSNNGDVSGNHGNFDYWVVKLDSTIITSVIDIQNSSSVIQVYPNPTTGNLNFELDKKYAELSITIKNVLGQNIQNEQFSATNNFQLTINGSNGIYFVHITYQDGQVAVVKVVKE